jgi:hypothetical protein
MLRLSILVLLVVLVSGCNPSLDECMARDVGTLTESEIATCYDLASQWSDQPDEERQREVLTYWNTLPTPVPSPTPTPPTKTVGFLEFRYSHTEWHPAPAEVTWFDVRNLSGSGREVEAILWTAKDSGGNNYGFSPFRTTLSTSGGQGCWRVISLAYPSLRAGAEWENHCRVGFIWYLQEPNVHITEVKYDGTKLPFTPQSEG